ncbi:MAG: DASS family sodium-coupled anion symporter [Gammaproteobacteria bacterium]|nr:DASS family sodium-coupled anion symporter [Gammaproteobacteria bacterium]
MLLLPPPEGLALAPWRVAAVAMLLAIFWLSEAIPIAATALLPLVLFPTLGVAPIGDVAPPYANPLIFLFLGGFLIALAIERWNLHRRIALTVLSKVGAREDLQIGGFMIATAALSMWVSNTATTVMMLPVALSVVPRGPDGNVDPDKRGFATALMLGVAYGASIGGFITLIGTPPNAFLAGFMLEQYDFQIGFAQWMVLATPISLVMFVFCWLLLTRWLFPIMRHELPGARKAIRDALTAMGPASVAEKRVAVVFAVTAVLWIARPLLSGFFPALQLSDTSIAMFGALLLFFVPNGIEKGEFLLTWEYAERLPWGVLLLFGGGLTLASAVSDSGLAAWIGEELRALEGWPVILLLLAVATLIVFLTELTSNIATSATFLPVVVALAESLGQHPLMLAIPAILAASFAFMLPVATPPNAIVFGSGQITIPQMARAGIWLNLVGIVVIVAAAYLLTKPVFGI